MTFIPSQGHCVANRKRTILSEIDLVRWESKIGKQKGEFVY